jgi:hypothetical protein
VIRPHFKGMWGLDRKRIERATDLLQTRPHRKKDCRAKGGQALLWFSQRIQYYEPKRLHSSTRAISDSRCTATYDLLVFGLCQAKY